MSECAALQVSHTGATFQGGVQGTYDQWTKGVQSFNNDGTGGPVTGRGVGYMQPSFDTDHNNIIMTTVVTQYE